ncbi:T9SS type A sorting domain-containing protein [candidate division KSB1 bacterium]
MKKVILYCFIALFMSFHLFGQQFLNPGFESWENAGTVSDEPVNWSSIKTSDGGSTINNAAPVVWEKSTDAHGGSFSVLLTNKLTLGTIVATGTLTNGRVHAEFNPSAGYVFTNSNDPKWHTALTLRPDSIVIWAKYTPQGTDTAQVKVLLHTSDGTLPPTTANQANWVGYAQLNIIGAVNSWTRFSTPFIYLNGNNPQYVLSVLTAGAGTLAIAESKAWYDDIELIYNPVGINESVRNQGWIYVSGNSIFLENLPISYMDKTMMDIINIHGSLVYSELVTSKSVTFDNDLISTGIYLVRIYNKNNNYTQKIYIK